MRARSPAGRGGERASAALPLLDDITTSPASRRLASARPALAPKCQLILARTLRARASFFGCGYAAPGLCYNPRQWQNQFTARKLSITRIHAVRSLTSGSHGDANLRPAQRRASAPQVLAREL